MSEIYTIAILKAKANQIDKLISVLEELTIETRKEKGSLEYGFYQDQLDSNIIISFEKWLDSSSEAAHWQTAHLQDVLVKLEDILAQAPVIYKGPKII